MQKRIIVLSVICIDYTTKEFIRYHNLDIKNISQKESLIIQMQYVPIDIYAEKPKIISKDKIKKILGESPDHLDALVLTFAQEEYAEYKPDTKIKEAEKTEWEKKLDRLMYGNVEEEEDKLKVRI